MKKIRLRCDVATFERGNIVEVGNGKDQLSQKTFDTLDPHHFEEVKEEMLASTKGLQDELKSATRRADGLETANTGLTAKVSKLVDGIKGIDLTQNDDKLKAAVKKLQEGV